MDTLAGCTLVLKARTNVRSATKTDVKAAGKAAAAWIAKRAASVANGTKLLTAWTLKCARTVSHWKSGERIPDSADLLLIGRHCPDTQRRVIAFWTMPDEAMRDPAAFLEQEEHVAKIDGLLRRLARGAVNGSKKAAQKTGLSRLRFKRRKAVTP